MAEEKEEKFICPKCERELPRKNLTYCPYCGEIFIKKKNLKMRILKHYEKPLIILIISMILMSTGIYLLTITGEESINIEGTIYIVKTHIYKNQALTLIIIGLFTNIISLILFTKQNIEVEEET